MTNEFGIFSMRKDLSFSRALAMSVVVAALVCACSKPTPEAYIESAKAHLAKRENKAAVIELRNALQKRPKLAEARFLLGRALLETGEFPNAEKELRTALELGYPAQQLAAPLAHALALLGRYPEILDEIFRSM